MWYTVYECGLLGLISYLIPGSITSYVTLDKLLNLFVL